MTARCSGCSPNAACAEPNPSRASPPTLPPPPPLPLPPSPLPPSPSPVRILFLGDLMGRSGREAARTAVPRLRAEHKLDFVIANGENAAGGAGIKPDLAEALFAAGVDVITGGNHSWDKREVIAYIAGEPRLLRPANLIAAPGSGSILAPLADGSARRVLVLNLIGRLFMEPAESPFAAAEEALQTCRLAREASAILVDFHAEATSEKQALGHLLDGRVSAVIGTHTHVPTADERILPGGTAWQSDAGMCGDYDSVIGKEKDAAAERFTRRPTAARAATASGEASLAGLFIETDERSGLAKRVSRFAEGGALSPAPIPPL